MSICLTCRRVKDFTILLVRTERRLLATPLSSVDRGLIWFAPADYVDADDVAAVGAFNGFLPDIDLQSVAFSEQNINSLHNGVGVIDAIGVEVNTNLFRANSKLFGEADNLIDDTGSLRSCFGWNWAFCSQLAHLLEGLSVQVMRTLFAFVDRIGSCRIVKLLGCAFNIVVMRVIIKCSRCFVRPRFFSSTTNSKLACLVPASLVVLSTSSSSSVRAMINFASASPRLDTTCSLNQPVVLVG